MAGVVSGFTAAAQAQVGKDQAAATIAREFDVKVLRVRPGEIDGSPVWFVTVMEPGGNFNTAFQVSTLAVDQVSGALVPEFRQGPNGALGTGSSIGTRSDIRPESLRSGAWR